MSKADELLEVLEEFGLPSKEYQSDVDGLFKDLRSNMKDMVRFMRDEPMSGNRQAIDVLFLSSMNDSKQFMKDAKAILMKKLPKYNFKFIRLDPFRERSFAGKKISPDLGDYFKAIIEYQGTV